MRAEIMRSANPGRFTLILEGDSADITSILGLMRAGGDCDLADIIGKQSARNPQHVQIARQCLHALFSELIGVAEKFDRYIKETKTAKP